MIELGQLFLNSASMSETAASEVGEDKKEELVLGPDSFIGLMELMLPKPPPIPPSKNSLGSFVEGEEFAQSEDNLNPIDSMDEIEVTQDALERIDAHGALAWINSENYEPPKMAEPINPESSDELTNQSAKTLENHLSDPFAQSTQPIENSEEGSASENLASSRSSFFDTALAEDSIAISDIFEDTLQIKESEQVLDKTGISTKPVEITKTQRQASELEDNRFVTTNSLTSVQAGESLDAELSTELQRADNASKQPLVDKNQVDARVPIKNQESMKSSFVAQPEEVASEALSQDAIELTSQPKDKNHSINPYEEIIPSSKIDFHTTETESGPTNQIIETLQPVISPTNAMYTTQPNWSVSAPKTLEIPTTLGSPQWADQFAEQVVWVGQSSSQSAVIKIHPEDLGPLEISVKVVDDLASVTITSHSSHVREMVDQAVPRLREMMAENGLSLVNTSIGSDGKSRQSQQQSGSSEQGGSGYVTDDKVLPSATPKKASKGLVDYFA